MNGRNRNQNNQQNNKKNVVCKYWQKGNCVKGNQCQFAHTNNVNNFGGQQQGFQTNNRFGALGQDGFNNQGFGNNNSFGNNNFGGGGFQNNQNRQQNNFTQNNQRNQKNNDQNADSGQPLTPEQLKKMVQEDLSNHTMWPLSCYGHEKGIPCDITGEISPEELRYQAYICRAQQGNLMQYNMMVQQMIDEMNAKKQACIQKFSNPQSSGFGSGSSVFGAAPMSSSLNANAFGNASAFGNPSAFGSQPQPTTNAFQQPSNPMSSPFGQPSIAPATTTMGSVFGQPSAPTSVFSPAPAASPFGQPQQQQQQSTMSVFGSASPMGVGGSSSVFGNGPSLNSTLGGMNAPNSFNSPSASVFGGNSNMNAPSSSSVFASNPSTQVAPTNLMNAFSMTTTPSNVGDTPTLTPNNSNLSQNAMEAFSAPSFSWGKIPEEPPLPQFC